MWNWGGQQNTTNVTLRHSQAGAGWGTGEGCWLHVHTPHSLKEPALLLYCPQELEEEEAFCAAPFPSFPGNCAASRSSGSEVVGGVWILVLCGVTSTPISEPLRLRRSVTCTHTHTLTAHF